MLDRMKKKIMKKKEMEKEDKKGRSSTNTCKHPTIHHSPWVNSMR